MKKILLIVLFLCFLSVPVYAQITLALQEKCAEGAKKFFLERINSYGGSWGGFSDEKGHGYNHFTSHYNKKLDKCFIRIDYCYFPKDMNEKDFRLIEIWNAFEGNLLAGCSLYQINRILDPWDCKVGNKKCNSLSEFKNLIRPYMEE